MQCPMPATLMDEGLIRPHPKERTQAS